MNLSMPENALMQAFKRRVIQHTFAHLISIAGNTPGLMKHLWMIHFFKKMKVSAIANLILFRGGTTGDRIAIQVQENRRVLQRGDRSAPKPTSGPFLLAGLPLHEWRVQGGEVHWSRQRCCVPY